MSFISQLAKNRVLAKQAGQVGGGANGGKVSGGELGVPLGPNAGKPSAKKKSPGLSGAMMRQSVSDLFVSGEKLGLPLPLLARHAVSFGTLKADMDALVEALHDPRARRDATTQALLSELPVRLLTALSAGLSSIDAQNSALSISAVLRGIRKLMEQPQAPTADHVRALERIAYVAGELKHAEMGSDLAHAMESLTAVRDPMVLESIGAAILPASNAIEESGASKSALFKLTIDTLIGTAARGKEPAAEAKAIAQARKLELTPGQLKVAVSRAIAGREEKAHIEDDWQAQTKQAEAAARQLKEGLPAGDHPLRALLEQAQVELTPQCRNIWIQVMAQQLGQPPGVARAIGVGLLELLSGPNPPPVEVAAQVAQSLVALADRNVTPEGLLQLASEHFAKAPPVEVPATLALLNNVLAGLSEEARRRVLATEGVELDGTSGLCAIANGLAGLSARFMLANGPLPALVGALEVARDEASLRQVLRHGARFAAAIPDNENGGIVELLRKTLPQDASVAAAHDMDLGVVASAHPLIPADSVARVVSAAFAHGHDVSDWLADAEAWFKNGRGNKNHIRNLRTLVATLEEGGSDSIAFVRRLMGMKLSGQMLCRTVEAILIDTNYAPSKEFADKAMATMAKGDSLLAQIEGRQSAKLMKDLGLEALLGKDAKLQPTKFGLDQVQNGASGLFKNGVGQAGIDQKILHSLLIAALEDKVNAHRFETPYAQKQLKGLSAQQLKLWREPSLMTHVRFSGNGQAKFDERVKAGAKLGKLIFSRMTEAWGELPALERKRDGVVEKLRKLNKNQRAERLELVQQLSGLPAKIAAMRWAESIATLTPANVTPQRFERLGSQIQDMSKLLGPVAEEAIRALVWTLRLSDIQYSQVITNDDPDLATMFRLATTNCLGYPGDGAALAYIVDASKKMIVTTTAAGEPRRAVIRLVARKDKGHEGEPMLLLERTYPHDTNAEERQRLIEHMLRRSAQMGIACGFATEYYWDSSKTQRAIIDMNKVLEELCERYDTTVDKKVMTVTNRPSNCKVEYMDSAPPNGAAGKGVVGVRKFTEQVEKDFENEFVILEPKQ